MAALTNHSPSHGGAEEGDDLGEAAGLLEGALGLRIEVIDPDPGVCCLSFSPERFFIFHGGLHMALDVAMMGGHQVVCGACIQRQGDDAGSMVSDWQLYELDRVPKSRGLGGIDKGACLLFGVKTFFKKFIRLANVLPVF